MAIETSEAPASVTPSKTLATGILRQIRRFIPGLRRTSLIQPAVENTSYIQSNPTMELEAVPSQPSKGPSTKDSTKTREERIAAYKLRKSQVIAVANTAPVDPLPVSPAEVTAPETDASPERRVVERLSSNHTLTIGPEEIPWISIPEKINLDLVRIGPGIETYFGDFIRGKKLLRAQEKSAKVVGLSNMDELFFRRIEGWLQKGGGRIRMRVLDKPSTKKEIYKVTGNQGERMYFLRFGDIDGKFVIIRIAMCSNANSENDDVMPVLSTEQRRKK